MQQPPHWRSGVILSMSTCACVCVYVCVRVVNRKNGLLHDVTHESQHPYNGALIRRRRSAFTHCTRQTRRRTHCIFAHTHTHTTKVHTMRAKSEYHTASITECAYTDERLHCRVRAAGRRRRVCCTTSAPIWFTSVRIVCERRPYNCTRACALALQRTN